MDFARTSLVGKARKRPDLVKQVTRKLRQEGPFATYRAVMGRLDAAPWIAVPFAAFLARRAAGL